ncbi:MAG: glycosyltransferase [Thermoleophilia bacterium]|nr:glycosyltransferase [Thermoleophilia bacterium]
MNGLLAERNAGIRSSIISTISDGDEANVTPAVSRLSSAGIDVKMFPRIRFLAKAEAWGFSTRMIFWMIRNLKNFDIVHLQYVWCMSSICGTLVARIYGLSVVITPHESLTNYDIDVASNSVPKRRLKMALKWFYLRTADRLVFMSDLEHRDTESASTPFELISHAVQESVIPSALPSEHQVDGPFRIAFLGRNIPKKGIDLIIKALGRNQDRPWKLFVAGPPGTLEFAAEIQELAESLGVSDAVSWVGFLSNRQELFDNCDVLAMPSAYEGFGMVAAEAMCRGVPVIVPRLSGVAEIVSEYEAGIVMSESSVECLEAALLTMDDNPRMRREFGENGLLAANSRLTYEAYASSTSALYATLISGSSSRM